MMICLPQKWFKKIVAWKRIYFMLKKNLKTNKTKLLTAVIPSFGK